jgi:hypothetical protein
LGLTDLGVVLADGGQRMADIAELGEHSELFGPVASAPTLWRALNELDIPASRRVETARTRDSVPSSDSVLRVIPGREAI